MILSLMRLLFFDSSVPEWVFGGILIVLLLAIFGSIVWGGVLDYRYTGPYTLLAASSKQKWQWAAMIMFWYTISLPLLGLIDPLLNISDPRHWSGFPVFCSGLWIVAFPIGVLAKRRKLDQQLKGYQTLDRTIKSGFYQQLTASPWISWWFRLMSLFNNTERKRFFEAGYPEEDELEPETDPILSSWLVKLSDNAEVIRRQFAKTYPEERILFASMANLQEVSRKPAISWMTGLHRRYGVVIITEEFLFFKSGFLSLAMFISIAIALIPLTLSIGFLYLIYFLYNGAGFNFSLDLITFILLLLPVLLFLMLFFIFGLFIFQYRPHQEQIVFHNTQDIALEMVPGVTYRLPLLTITTIHKTFKVVCFKTLPNEIVQAISRNRNSVNSRSDGSTTPANG